MVAKRWFVDLVGELLPEPGFQAVELLNEGDDGTALLSRVGPFNIDGSGKSAALRSGKSAVSRKGGTT